MNYRIYYMKDEFFSKGICGQAPNATRLTDTHQLVAIIQAETLEEAFHHMQAEIWSPRGEARELIDALGLTHTSMSVGDCIVDQYDMVHLTANIGFKGIGKKVAGKTAPPLVPE